MRFDCFPYRKGKYARTSMGSCDVKQQGSLGQPNAIKVNLSSLLEHMTITHIYKSQFYSLQVDRTGKNRTVVPVKVSKTITWQKTIHDQCIGCFASGQFPNPQVCSCKVCFILWNSINIFLFKGINNKINLVLWDLINYLYKFLSLFRRKQS